MGARSRGFSIIELIVVITIAAILMAWGYPRLSTLVAKYRLDNAAWNLTTDLQKVRLRAIGEGTRFRVVFDTANKSYQVQKEIASVFTSQGGALALEDAGLIQISLTADPVFTPRGSVETPSVITLTAPGGGTRLVAAQSSGRIYVQ